MKKNLLALLCVQGLVSSTVSYGMEEVNKEDSTLKWGTVLSNGGVVFSGLDLLQMSAHEGNPLAQFTLAESYIQGIVVPKDMEKAHELLVKAAQKDFSQAEHYLGAMWLDGWTKADGSIVPPNPLEALKHFEKAARKGYDKSQYNAGRMYYDGKFVEKDLDKAFDLLLAGAKQGEFLCKLIIAQMYREGWTRKDGTIVPSNPEQSFYWHQKSAEAGNAYCLHDLAGLYYTGFGTQKDVDRAFECYLKAAKQGFDLSQKNLGTLLDSGWEKQDGTIVPPNHEEALKWLEKSATQNNDFEVINRIVYLYKNGWTRPDGTTVQPNAERVAYWIKKLSK